MTTYIRALFLFIASIAFGTTIAEAQVYVPGGAGLPFIAINTFTTPATTVSYAACSLGCSVFYQLSSGVRAITLTGFPSAPVVLPFGINDMYGRQQLAAVPTSTGFSVESEISGGVATSDNTVGEAIIISLGSSGGSGGQSNPTPTPVPTSTATAAPTATPAPTSTPTAAPTVTPTATAIPSGYVLPEAADTEADRIAGVNTHFNYSGNVYVTNYPAVKSVLQAMGIRYFRDGPDTSNVNSGVNGPSDMVSSGFKFDVITNTTQPASYMANYIATSNVVPTYIENPSEPNCNSTNGDNSCFQSGGNGTWGSTVSSFASANYSGFAALTGSPKVLGPALAWANLATNPWAILGNVSSSVDFGNLHVYPKNPETSGNGGGFTTPCPSYSTMPVPSTGSVGTGSLYSSTCLAQQSFGAKHIVVTEYGFPTAYVDQNLSNALANTTLVDYVLRGGLFLGLPGQHVDHVFTYQGCDQPAPSDGFQAYGLCDLNGALKPNGAALGNLISLYNDPGSAVAPSAVPFSISGMTSADYYKLSEKRDGTYILAMWRGCEEETAGFTLESCGSDAITVNFGSQVPTSMLQVTPNGSNATGTGAFTYSTVSSGTYNGGTMAVTLGGTPSIYEFKYSGSAPNPAPTITASSTYTPNPVPTATAAGNQYAYAAAVATDSPSAFYPMADQSGTTVADASGNGNTGTYVGTPTLFQAGPFAASFSVAFNGTSQYAQLPITLPAPPFSVEFWASPISNTSNANVLGQQNVYSAHSGFGFLDNNGTDQINIGTGTGTNSYSPALSYSPGAWLNTVVTMDASHNLVIYQNGVNKYSIAASNVTLDSSTLLNLARNTSGYNFNGRISDVSVYGTVLSQARVTAHYNAASVASATPTPTPTASPTASPTSTPTATPTPGQGAYNAAVLADSPSAFYPMNESSGTSMADASGHANNGAYVGSPTLASAGPFTGALSAAFSGTAQYATLPIVLPTPPFTVEFWYNPAANTANAPLVAQSYTYSSHTGFDFLDNSGSYQIVAGFTSGSYGNYNVTSVPATVGTWQYAAFTVDAAANLVAYQNGTSRYSLQSGTAFSPDTTTLLSLARFTSGSANLFNGRLSNVAIYPSILSPARIAAHYGVVGTLSYQANTERLAWLSLPWSVLEPFVPMEKPR